MIWFKSFRMRRALQQLGNGSRDDLERTIRKLGKIGCQDAAPQLRRYLVHSNCDMRATTAAALEKLGEAKWRTCIKGDLDGDFERLGATKDPRILEPLLAALGDTDTARPACQALVNLGDLQACEPLYQMAVKKGQHRQQAALALAKLGDKRAADILLGFLERSGRPWIAVEGLAILGEKRAVEPLATLLSREMDADFKILVVKALEQLEDDRALPGLERLITADSEKLREVAINAIRKLGHKVSVSGLLPRLESKDWQEREYAVRLCAELPEHEVLPHLVRALQDPVTTIRKTAAQALEQRGWLPETDRELAGYMAGLGRFRNVGAKDGVNRKNALVMAAKIAIDPGRLDDAPNEIVGLIGELGATGDSTAAELLVQVIENYYSSEKAKAVSAISLAHIGAAAIRPIVAGILNAAKQRHEYPLESRGKREVPPAMLVSLLGTVMGNAELRKVPLEDLQEVQLLPPELLICFYETTDASRSDSDGSHVVQNDRIDCTRVKGIAMAELRKRGARLPP